MKMSIKSSAKPSKVRLRSHSGIARKMKNAQSPKASLSNDLKAKYAKNSVRVRVGDSVKLVRGEYSGIEGKVQKVFASEGLVTVEGITREKIAGGTTPVRIHTSNLFVTALNLEDKWRKSSIEGTQ